MNLVIIDGYLTKEPEVKMTPNGKKVCSFQLKTEKGKDVNGNREYDWHNFQAWDNKADFLGNYCHEGYKMLVTGRIVNRRWETQNGDKQKATEIVCDRLEIERSKEANAGQGNYHPQQNRSQKAQNEPREGWGKPLDVDESDLPF